MKPDNPQAFPLPHVIADANDPNFKLGRNGMTLRDYFANSAMSQIITSYGFDSKATEIDLRRPLGDYSKLAYRIADAMLLERTKTND